jgi:CspA family cold shock protein
MVFQLYARLNELAIITIQYMKTGWEALNMQKETGKVIWFNHRKGYGFIQTSRGEEVFVHHSAINMNGYRILAVGDCVMFAIAKGPKGLHAENVVKDIR